MTDKIAITEDAARLAREVLTAESARGRDWLAAAAGNEALAEELRTGRCRCGKMLGEDAAGCRWHESLRLTVAEVMRKVWDGRGDTAGTGPRAEDLELLGRYLPAEFLFCYEVLVHRSVVVPGSARGGRGYDEAVEVGAGRRSPAAVKSGTTEVRGGANGSSRRGGSGKPVIRSEQAVVFRAKIDRRLRRLSRDMLTWLEQKGSFKTDVVYRCSGRKCGRFAEEGWNYCPNCGAQVDRRVRS